MLDSFLRNELNNKYGSEQVFVVPYSVVSGLPNKFSGASIHDIDSIERKGRFILRCDAEYNFALSQLIPYVVVTNKDESEFFVSRRIGGDDRLLGLWSFFGGHLDPLDYTAKESVVLNGAKRELQEEIRYQMCKGTSMDFLGIIRDIGSKTAEHTGFLFKVHVNWAKINELQKLEGRWMTFNEIFSNYEKFESWGRYAIDSLFLQKAKKERDS